MAESPVERRQRQPETAWARFATRRCAAASSSLSLWRGCTGGGDGGGEAAKEPGAGASFAPPDKCASLKRGTRLWRKRLGSTSRGVVDVSVGGIGSLSCSSLLAPGALPLASA
eukprot:13095-Pleurochrysis_carterae.AAC.1